MKILGIETSCDETGVAILEKKGQRIQILSNMVASSASLQEKYGGVLPEQAAREQLKVIIPILEQALLEAKIEPKEIDAIAVTYGPGLIGSLLVGVETAKTLSIIWQKPLIPVNHLLGHFYANWIIQGQEVRSMNQGFKNKKPIIHDSYPIPQFPIIGLLVSGGHTDLVLFASHNKYQYLGGTRDDAAGECFDKCARLLGLPYPGGALLSKLADRGKPGEFKLPRPMLERNFTTKGGPAYGWDFSFSGLKTAFANLVQSSGLVVYSKKPTTNYELITNNHLPDLCASLEQAIVDVLVTKTVQAAKTYQVKNVMVAGGVAANQRLRSELKLKIENLKLKIKLSIPDAKLCTDNGAMIASRAFFEKPTKDPLLVATNPNLSLQSA